MATGINEPMLTEAAEKGNVESSVKSTIEKQHKSAKKKDKQINKESPKVRIDTIAELLTNHIVKGNEVKLLAAPPEDDADGDDENDTLPIAEEVADQARKANALRKQLRPTDLKLLMTRYSEETDGGAE